MTSLDELIERNDPDPLLREINTRCANRNWQGVLEIRDRCEMATERGKTLWGVAEHAAYRLVLEAPAEFVGLAFDAKTGPLGIGPLPEVAASTHTWEELAPHIEDGPLRGMLAYECVALGEDLSGDTSLVGHQAAFELPLRLFDWEPEYVKAEYLEDSANFPAPIASITQSRLITDERGELLDEPSIIESWRKVVSSWLADSNGSANITVVEGSVDYAIQHVHKDVTTVAQITTASALQLMCWAAASGGAHGRRRGIAAGRSTTWLALADTCGLLDDGELPSGEELGRHVNELQWHTWNEADSSDAWNLRLAVHDPVDGISIAINAYDSLESSD
jgi:hypothetical protein